MKDDFFKELKVDKKKKVGKRIEVEYYGFGFQWATVGFDSDEEFEDHMMTEYLKGRLDRMVVTVYQRDYQTVIGVYEWKSRKYVRENGGLVGWVEK